MQLLSWFFPLLSGTPYYVPLWIFPLIPLKCWSFSEFVSFYAFPLNHLIYFHGFICCSVDSLIYIYILRLLLWAPNLNTQLQLNTWDMACLIGTSKRNSACHKYIFVIQIFHFSSIHVKISIFDDSDLYPHSCPGLKLGSHPRLCLTSRPDLLSLSS